MPALFTNMDISPNSNDLYDLENSFTLSRLSKSSTKLYTLEDSTPLPIR